MNEQNKLIEDQFKRLPEALQKALNVVSWSSTVKEIAVLNKLNFEQVGTVERETMFVIYGFEKPEDYIGNVMREAQIDETTAITIAEAVNEKVLNVIALKAEEFEKQQPVAVPVSVPEIPPVNLPAVEPGETAHAVEPLKESEKMPAQKPVTEDPKQAWARKPWSASEQAYKYPDGKDPYHEPLV